MLLLLLMSEYIWTNIAFSSINEGRLHDGFPIDLVFSLLHLLDLENLILLTICKVETLFIYLFLQNTHVHY